MTASPGRTTFNNAGTTSSSRADDVDRPARAEPHRVGERLDRDARDRLLARGVDVGQHDLVGVLQRRPECLHQLLRARVAVRLEGDDEPPAERGARGGEHRRDLGRVMAVVVHHEHAARLAVPLESTFGALELAERRGDALELDAQAVGRGHRGERVLEVVAAGHAELELAEQIGAIGPAPVDGAARPEAAERDRQCRRSAHPGSRARTSTTRRVTRGSTGASAGSSAHAITLP